MNNTTIPTQSTLNGIDIEQQSRTMEGVRENPALGEVQFCAVNRWQGGTQTRSRITAFDTAGGHHTHVEDFAVDTDLPQAFLGTDLGCGGDVSGRPDNRRFPNRVGPLRNDPADRRSLGGTPPGRRSCFGDS